MRTLTRVAVTATFLALPMLLATSLALAPPAYPQSVATKGDIAAPPPESEAARCELPLWYLAELSGWRVLKGAKAKAYINAAFSKHPPADAVAFTVSGDAAAIILAKDGCVVGRRMTTAELHAKIMIRAFGFPA